MEYTISNWSCYKDVVDLGRRRKAVNEISGLEETSLKQQITRSAMLTLKKQPFSCEILQFEP